jgi:hypothetical protein
MTGHCVRCGIQGPSPCQWCQDEIEGKPRALAPLPTDPLAASQSGRIPGAIPMKFSALTSERRRPPLAFWRRPDERD